MKRLTKYIVLSLAAIMTLTPILAKADRNIENEEIVPITSPIDEVDQSDYFKYEGKIIEVNANEKSFSIRVTDDEEDIYSGKVFFITEDTILLNDETREFVTKDILEEGMTISGYYSKDTIILESMPPQLSVDVVIINESKEPVSIHVSKFNDELISIDNILKILPSEDTIIINRDGEKVEKEDIIDKDLIVFYTISTRSIPAQTTPEKIILIEREEKEPKIIILDQLVIDGVETILNNLAYENEEGVVMIPLRQVAETLGYEVKWNNETKTAELIKGPHWFAVTIGDNNYNFAKMLLRLETSPELKNSTTYVPITFLKEVMGLNVEILEEGLINIELKDL